MSGWVGKSFWISVAMRPSPKQQALAPKRGQILKFEGPESVIEDPKFAVLQAPRVNGKPTLHLIWVHIS